MKNKFSYSNRSFISDFLLLFASVFLFIVANPNFLISKGLGFFGWFIYVPVLLLIKNKSIKTVWIYGFIYGIIAYGIYGYWLIDYHPLAIIIVCVSYGIILALLFLLLCVSDSIFKVNGWLLQWAILCLYEYCKTLGFAGASYGVTAYTQWRYSVLIQFCNVFGVFGLNALMIFNSVVIYAMIQKSMEKKFILTKLLVGQERKNIRSHINYASQKEKILRDTSITIPLIGMIIEIVFVLFIIFYGIYQLHNDRFASCDTITVAAIQNNDVSSKSTVDDYRINVRNLIALTDEAREYNPEIKIVVWPETAVVPAIVHHYNEKKDVMRYRIVKSVLDYINLDNLTFVIGNGHYGELEGNFHKKYNSALIFEGKKNTIPPEPEFYYKQHLVPFSESFPLEKQFPKFSKILLNGQQTFWVPGTENKVFRSKGLNFSTLICFEDTFTTTARKMYLNGSRCFMNLSNDSWSESRACQNQHLAMAVFRSVENNVPSVRSTSTGETCIINPYGKITAMAPDFCLSYVIGEIPLIQMNEKPGFYTTYGDYCGWGFVFVIALMLLIKIITVIIDAIKLRLKYR